MSTTPNASLNIMATGSNVGTWGDALNANFQSIDSHLGEVIAARGSSPNVGGRIGSAEASITSARAEIATLKTKASESGDEISALKKKSDEQKDALAQTNASLSGAKGELERLKTQAAEEKEKLSSAQSDIAAAKVSIASLTEHKESSATSIAELREFKESASGKIAALEQSSRALTLRVETLEAGLSAAKEKLDRLTDNVDINTGTLSTIQQTIDEKITQATSSITRRYEKDEIPVEKAASGNTTVSTEIEGLPPDSIVRVFGNVDIPAGAILSTSVLDVGGKRTVRITLSEQIPEELTTLRVVGIG